MTRIFLLLALLSACVEPEECSLDADESALTPSVTLVADDTATMSLDDWMLLNDTVTRIESYRDCLGALPRCGELPTLRMIQNPVYHSEAPLVTISYRDWQDIGAWAVVASRWTRCAL